MLSGIKECFEGECLLQPTLVVAGLNHRSAGVEVRERFWMSGCRQAEVLSMLAQGEGIEEVVVFSTSNRTEFILWGDPTLAVNSILRLLSSEYDLKLQEWNSFYRLLDEQALAHAFRVACGLDSMYIGEGHIARQFATAWRHAENAGCTGRHLDAVLRKALSVRRRVRKETEFVSQLVSAPLAAARLAEQILGSVEAKDVVVIGAGNMAENAARELARRNPRSVCILSHNENSARELVLKLDSNSKQVVAGKIEDRSQHLTYADLVVSATSAARFIFNAEDMKQLAIQRNATDKKGQKLVLIDLALPRDIDPAVRAFDGVLLYDLEDLERAVEPRQKAARRDERTVELRRKVQWEEIRAGGRADRPGEADAERIVQREVREFRKILAPGETAPEVVALRARLDELCRQELESIRLEQGPFPKEQDRLIAAVGLRITHRIAGNLAKDFKNVETRGAKRMIVGA